ncbi:16S rRNA (cytosine(1402)-N(4))-methyltransferase RsmH [Methylobacillus flagellatus]|uniref:Ribosomal RNA small subunit methyltransferase H n=1 Tax=Methylobacillus flagellatus (strain ATCC 51484 / DSM 6875 / VKM B-1610 / KT) TaxID=265072 RepID=RSMH_METFK|nr:16S rRNA (cytosine(1402)-N(4))-methyltransferase RsmH [Methylobacillus flagellatus]Q1GYZ3.1 RecName: Full=Ribosomal RNA small subunit methyltransferase H; AltName: Full=16S rRNA m(4)C1402 methyltransferase; AltName: Full=rRNA (cytosine-N(4)-)-methyltransferase RsmH [Methylobacillus flagellatus KT]ABE50544.1 methyltransferase [Methylobacillus flagellatus KT]
MSAGISHVPAAQVSQHVTVLLEEAVEALSIKPDGVYVDGTFGRGGHSRKILEKLGAQGRLVALDRDLAAIQAAQGIQDARFKIVHSHFAAMAQVLASLNIQQVDGVLLDLGISSPQIDEGERGFSFRFDGPLDMRMDQSRGQTAAEFIATATEQELTRVIKEYGEERFAKQIARAIVAQRAGGMDISTTGQLAKIVAGAVPKVEPGQDPATRTFQALRIFINQELEELSLTLPQCLSLLAPQGRLAVISFHSLEDRIVKRFIRGEQDRDNLPAHFPVRASDLPQPRLVAIGRAVRPSEDEVRRNPRSRSAVLRVAERTAVL